MTTGATLLVATGATSEEDVSGAGTLSVSVAVTGQIVVDKATVAVTMTML